MARRQDLRIKMIYAALEHVPQLGWTEETLRRAARDLGEADSMSWRLFPGGVDQAIELWNMELDKKMIRGLGRYKLEKKRVRDRIFLAVKLRIEALGDHKSATIATSKYLALPHHAPLGTKMLFTTVDEMWHQAGDRSKDYNWYTKRGLLSGVYSSTLIYWMQDKSPDNEKTWEFLQKRIDNVMELGRLPKQSLDCLKDLQSRAVDIFNALRP